MKINPIPGIKIWIISIWLLALFLLAGVFFWYNQLKYLLPTPVPIAYHQINPGEKIKLPASLAALHDKPLFLHFFNPDCPCSRFNMDHFKSLVKKYHNKLNFAVVLMASEGESPAEIRKRFDLDIPIFQDTTIAKNCGVYSTPQAVVLDAEDNLYYRGNYNKSRYCTDESTSYAKIAIENLIYHQTAYKFDDFALKAYGCTLPNCDK